MKDKLQKNHHKALYYRVRKYSIIGLCLIAIGAGIAVPVSIVLANEAKVQAAKDEEKNHDNFIVCSNLERI